MKKTNVAIIGCGTIANSAHMPSYSNNPLVNIKYFCDIIPERAEKAVNQYGVGKAIIDYKELLNDPELDLVSVCTPNNCHAPIAIDFLRAGKNVLCEKPAARSLAEALEMQKVQKETGKILNIGVVNRFNTAVNKIKDLIDNGDLGNIYHVYISFRSHRSIPGLGGAFTTNAIAGGGVLIDWGVHFIDLVMYCLGDPKPISATGKAYSVLGKDMKDYTFKDMWAGPPNYDGTYDVEDFISGFVRTETATLSLNGAWAQNIGENEMYIDFLGDKAGVRLMYGANFTMYAYKNGMLLETTPSFTTSDMFQNEIDQNVEAVREGKKITSHIDNAVITSTIMQALYDSSAQGKEIIL